MTGILVRQPACRRVTLSYPTPLTDLLASCRESAHSPDEGTLDTTVTGQLAMSVVASWRLREKKKKTTNQNKRQSKKRLEMAHVDVVFNPLLPLGAS